MSFSELNWTDFDVWAIVACRGITVVDAAHVQSYRAWLQRNGYGMSSLDFSGGLGPAVVTLGKLLRWEEQFGYILADDSRNLDALQNGFGLPVRLGSGTVLELLNADVAHAEDSRWFKGLLSIASEYSHHQLALGSRFFTTLILDSASKLVGQTYESLGIPVPFWRAGRKNPFEDEARHEKTS
jgi:hypothetical protein